MIVDRRERAVAIVGLGAILPDAPSAQAFWRNIVAKRYSITDVTPDRWDPADYYDPDPSVPDKTYSKIGGWVRGFAFDWKKFTIPPRVAAAMDEGQQWAVTVAAEALADYGFPGRPLDQERTAVILGTAMAGELHYLTNLRVMFPEFHNALNGVAEFRDLPFEVRTAILSRWHQALDKRLPPITEDTMPGELANIMSGRVANLLNLRGPNFITDAACASSFAAIESAIDLLVDGHCDSVLTGGVDRNMGPSSFVKFCKIGALSPSGTRPFGDGADGFVMGEGAGAFLLKRLVDAERDGDRIYAVIRGVAGSSDGKGKGITAPNPIGQKLAVQRAWEDAGLDPATATLVEAHGTSTKVGDVVEVTSLSEMFKSAGTQKIALGSAKSNIGHLKAGAGAAGFLKAVCALHYKTIPPTLNAVRPNPNIDFASSPFYLAHEAREWERTNGTPRRAGVSAYGFGGTNFHLVLEEYVPGALAIPDRSTVAVAGTSAPGGGAGAPAGASGIGPRGMRAPLRGLVALGASSATQLKEKLEALLARAKEGYLPPTAPPAPADLLAPERLVLDFGSRDELVDRLQKAERAMGFDTPQAWKALSAQGVFRGAGPRKGKLAFLFPGQGSQYVNMGKELAAREPVVAKAFADADEVMHRIVGHPLTEYIFVDENDKAAVARCEEMLMQTAITQPAVLTMDDALHRLLAEYNVRPDYVMGHSLGEYGALVAAGVLPFAHALEAAAARGREMTRVSLGDNGWMAAVMAPLAVVEETLRSLDGYVVAANINSSSQAVIGGETEAVKRAIEVFTQKGFQAIRLPVSHAFHTRIVAPASKPLRQVLDRLAVSSPKLPLVANVTGGLYPTTPDAIKDTLELQIASPVQWVKGLQTLFAEGCRTFVEVGPKKALKGFVDDILGSEPEVVSLFSNHPKPGAFQTFNHALCGLYAAGYGLPAEQAIEVRPVQAAPAAAVAAAPAPAPRAVAASAPAAPRLAAPAPAPAAPVTPSGGSTVSSPVPPSPAPNVETLAQMFASMVQNLGQGGGAPRAHDRNEVPAGSIVISGTGLGLPGAEKPVMDPTNAERILRGEQFIDLVPERFRVQMARKHVTRVVKSEDGSGSFQTIDDTADVIKLAGRPGPFDLSAEYGVNEKLVEALDITTQLAIAAGIDALREAGIPLVQTWRKTTTGKFLPDRWMLPESLRDETGVIFASAFPGMDRFADETERYFGHESLLAQRDALEELRQITRDADTLREIHRRITDLDDQLARTGYQFDRRFILRVLPMGHSQFAEYVGARGPNATCNAACAATAQGISIAEDWIRAGRCRRVIVVGADAVTSEKLLGWVGAGFLATGAAATDDKVSEAAVPFDRRRHGTILGMGACALVLESQDAVEERGMRGIVELLSSETRNSAFHATRLDVDHVSMTMESLIAAAERRFGINRFHVAPETVFMSHETFTPARGGSASAEVAALRRVFGPAASEIVMANTKGFTGHPMGVGIEDVIAVKILEHAIVPPVPNFKEVDPDLGPLTLSRGGRYPVKYAIHLAAGFGSQVAMTLTRRIPGSIERVDNAPLYQRWLDEASGYDRSETEVVKRTLRVVSKGAPSRPPAPSHWAWGTGPVRRAQSPGDGGLSASARPAPMPAAAIPAPVAAPAPAVAPRPAAVPASAPVAPVAAPAAPVAAKPAPPAAAAPAPVVTPTAPAPAAKSGEQEIRERVLKIVAEKTGYPPDMLDMDLDLEADLGVDTVKQAETFAAVREAYNIPRVENLRLRDFPTLKHVVGFVLKQRPDLATSPAPANAAPASSTQASARVSAAGGPTMAAAPAAVAPAASAPSVPASLPKSGADQVRAKVLQIVAEKTGYPPDMLDMDLDLEADLGVDTVKQAETFAAVREAYNIPRIENLKLRDFPTLKHVVGFVLSNRPDLAAAAPSPAPASVAPASATQAPAVAASEPQAASARLDPVTAKVLEIVAEKTGYPPDMLDMDLDLEADLGVDTVKQAETFAAVREAYNIPRIENLKLRDFPTLKHVVGFVLSNRPDLAAAAPSPAPASVAPASATQAPAVAASEPQAASARLDPVTAKVLEIVAEKTGYPTDMLDLDLDLEADLGVDTVKQAETFAAVREAYNIPRIENLKLRDFPTLKHVVGFVLSNRPDLAPSPAPASVAPASATQAPAVAASEPQAASARLDPVTAKVLEIVAEKTGYPTDMLDLDLDLEADLGVDTVKQAETFAAVREAYNIPRIENLKLRDFPTLKHVVGFVFANRPDLAGPPDGGPTPGGAPAPAASSSTSAAAAPVAAAPAITATLADADRAPRRVVVPSVRPPLDLCKPTSVSLSPGARVIVVHDERGAGDWLVELLGERGVTALSIKGAVTTEALEAQVSAWLAEGPVTGVYWLPALNVEPDLDTLDLDTFRELNRRRTKNLYATMRLLYGSIEGPGTFLVSATTLGGVFGQDAAGATAPLGGGVLGFTKAYKRERPDALVKVVDVDVTTSGTDVADRLLAETLTDPGIVEVGYKDGLRWTLTFEEQPAANGQPGLSLTKDSVFVVTGAAGGITSAIVADLAAASGGTFYLLDLVEPPDPADPHVVGLRRDRERLKLTLIEEAKARGERPTPVSIDKQILGIERRESALRAIESVTGVGGTAQYRAVNLLDGPAVSAVVEEITQKHGRIDVLLHAGGIEISRALADKEAREFDLVFDIKADGFFSLLRAAAGTPIGATVVFSSVAGRFGNSGQTDYSAANALLCCVSRSLRRSRPGTRAIAIDWTAWGGIGMATRGSIPKIMEMAGIEMLAPEVGIPTIRRELVAGGTADEIVVGGKLGILAEEWDAAGGLDTAKVVAALANRARPLSMIGHVKGAFLYGGLSVATTIDPKEQAYLYDHQIDGTPVLPGVMGTETFAELATVLCPGLEVAAVERAEFLAPFKFFRMQPGTLHLTASGRPAGDGDVRVGVVLSSVVQPKPELPPQVRVHFKGQVRMTRATAEKPEVAFAAPDGFTIGHDPIYRIYFHGPAYQVLEGVRLDDGRAVGRMVHGLPPNGTPDQAASLMTPRLIELCFQAAGILEVSKDQHLGLPTFYESVRVFRQPEEAEGERLYAVVSRTEGESPSYDVQVVDGRGRVFVDLRGYRTIALPGRITLEEAMAAANS